ncbi:uncharacterized protein [Watersipora subatra]|uniref:uncharacterized protein n=1 Tax=Watersipora subatra TaxID=2589382 RepID=UPI00355B894C
MLSATTIFSRNKELRLRDGDMIPPIRVKRQSLSRSSLWLSWKLNRSYQYLSLVIDSYLRVTNVTYSSAIQNLSKVLPDQRQCLMSSVEEEMISPLDTLLKYYCMVAYSTKIEKQPLESRFLSYLNDVTAHLNITAGGLINCTDRYVQTTNDDPVYDIFIPLQRLIFCFHQFLFFPFKVIELWP